MAGLWGGVLVVIYNIYTRVDFRSFRLNSTVRVDFRLYYSALRIISEVTYFNFELVNHGTCRYEVICLIII